MPIVQVLTPVIGDGKSPRSAFRPAVVEEYPTTMSRNVPDHPSIVKGFCVVEIICDDKTLIAIQANSKHSVLGHA